MKKKEVVPLLEGSSLHPVGMKSKTMYMPEDKVEIDNEFEEEILLTERKRKRRVSLLWQDCLLITLDFLQFLAILQSMALRWTWPESWLSNSYFIFLFNLDVFEFIKMHTPGVYITVQGYFIPSSTVPVNFGYIALAWFVAILVLVGLYLSIYGILLYRRSPSILTIMAFVRRVYFVVIQVLTLPLGTFVAHILQCTDLDKVDVMNDLKCFAGFHWLYVTFGLAILLFLFIIFPIYIIYITRSESVGSCAKHHESFLLLKETEYKVGLNKSWLLAHICLFSSFRFWGIYYRAVSQWFKMLIIIIMCASINNIQSQSLGVTVLFFLYFVALIFVRPYRILVYNLMTMLSYLCLGCLGLIGSLVTRYNAYNLSTPWLLPQYSKWLLTTIVVAWVVFWLMWMFYLTIRSALYHCKVIQTPIWPTFSTSDNDQLSLETKKFLKTFLHARFVLERTQRGPAMFAPVHELAKQIQILNAYCREAEFLGDALHGTMWDLLDEMIEIHAKLAVKSLFAETVKTSIQKTAREFMLVMPMFCQRLAQRDYDLILVSPMKRRMLLKMYCMGIFLNGRAEKVRKTNFLTQPALQRIWHEEPYSQTLEEEDGYYEDLYPDPLELKSDDSSVDISMASSESEDEDQLESVFSRLQTEEQMEVDLLGSATLTGLNETIADSLTPLQSRPNSATQSGPIQPSSGDGHVTPLQSRPNSANQHSQSRPSSSDGHVTSRPSTSKSNSSLNRQPIPEEETSGNRPPGYDNGAFQSEEPSTETASGCHLEGHENEGFEEEEGRTMENENEVTNAAERVMDMKIKDKKRKKRRNSKHESKA